MFDKQAYWANRFNTVKSEKEIDGKKTVVVNHAPKRGQGEPVKPVITDKIPKDKRFSPPQHLAMVGAAAMLVNRATSRQKIQDRSGSAPKKKQESMKPPFKHVVNPPQKPAPRRPADVSNHKALTARRQMKEELRQAAHRVKSGKVASND